MIRGLRRHWLSVLTILIGSGYVAARAILRIDVADGPVGIVDASVQLGLTVLLAIGIAVFGRERDATVRLLADGERQLRRLILRSPDAIAVVQDGRIAWGNGAAARLMGIAHIQALFGIDALTLIHPDDRPAQASNLARLSEVGQVDTADTRILRPDGRVLDAEIAAVAVRFHRRPAVQLMIRDVSTRRAEERALETSEHQLRNLLDGMGLIAMTVDADGVILFANRATYELLGREREALSGTSILELLVRGDINRAQAALQVAMSGGESRRTVDLSVKLPDDGVRTIRWHLALSGNGDAPCVLAIGEDVTAAVEASDRLERLLTAAPVGICAVDAGGTVRLAEGGPFSRRGGHEDAIVGDPSVVGSLPATVVGPLLEALAGRPSEALLQLDGRMYEATFSSTGGSGGGHGALGVLVDVTQRVNLEREGVRLATAIDQAMDAIVITDPSGSITYVNPAFERVTGYPRDEVLGRNPRILKSGEQDDAFYASMWRTITAGRAWSGELVNRHKSGTVFREVATITPVRDADGTIVNFVAVKHDVTRERQLEDALDREVRERAAIVTALERIGASGDPATIGAAVCEEVTQLPGIGMAAVFVFSERQVLTLAFVGPSEVPVVAGLALQPSRADYLRSRAALGPWAERWQIREIDGAYGERMAESGVQAIAHIPLRDDTGVFGVLGLGTFSRGDAADLLDRLPALGAMGAVASSHLSVAVRRALAEDGAHRDVELVIASQSFRPVFQPIVDLRTGEALGYEALTRFDDGTRPDIQFQRALGVGLGLELEVVTLRAAVASARALPAGAFLSVNVSPDLALRGSMLADVLVAADRPLVLEITEHAVVDDYPALRGVARSLPVPARLAVDDAGAGFASLRHVLELVPDIVKVDRSIVAGIDLDPARQALLAGLRHFAVRRGIQLIAEGVETTAELDALTSLAIPLGQGYLLGRPASASEALPEALRLAPTDPRPGDSRSGHPAMGTALPGGPVRGRRGSRAEAPAEPPAAT